MTEIKIVFDRPRGWFKEWKVCPQSEVKLSETGQREPLFSYLNERYAEVDFVAPRIACGSVGFMVDVRPWEELHEGMVMVILVENNYQPLRIDQNVIHAQESHAAIVGRDDFQRLLKSRKLVLMVDLDRTLVYSTEVEDASCVDATLKEEKDVHYYEIEETIKPGIKRTKKCLKTRLRPRVIDFLKNVSKLYELYICTTGTLVYAKAIAGILDRDNKLFRSRILSRDDLAVVSDEHDADIRYSKAAQIPKWFSPEAGKLLCVIDDQERVWHHVSNLVRVPPYAPKRKNEVAYEKTSPNLSEIDYDKTVDDDFLFYLEDILRRIHDSFYEKYDTVLQAVGSSNVPDLAEVIPTVKQQVLRGCNVVFSGIIPTELNAEFTPIYMSAVECGANVHDDIIVKRGHHSTTHLIIGAWGSDKVNKAEKTHTRIHIVTQDWLWFCAQHWIRIDEKPLFTVNKHNSMQFQANGLIR